MSLHSERRLSWRPAEKCGDWERMLMFIGSCRSIMLLVTCILRIFCFEQLGRVYIYSSSGSFQVQVSCRQMPGKIVGPISIKDQIQIQGDTPSSLSLLGGGRMTTSIIKNKNSDRPLQKGRKANKRDETYYEFCNES
jgi:hypothetical protein